MIIQSNDHYVLEVKCDRYAEDAISINIIAHILENTKWYTRTQNYIMHPTQLANMANHLLAAAQDATPYE